MMDDISCDFADYDHLVGYLVDNVKTSKNATHLVKACDSVCPLLLGSSNPDVSGIGAMISFFIQGVAVFIASNIFQTLIVLRYGGSKNKITLLKRLTENPSPLLRSFYKLADTTHKTSIALCLAVMTAAAIRVFQGDVSRVEIVILVLLSLYQFFVGALSLQFYMFYNPETSSFRACFSFSSATSGSCWFWHWQRPPQIFFPALYTLYSYCMLMAINMSVFAMTKQETDLHAVVLGKVSSACADERGFPSVEFFVFGAPFRHPSYNGYQAVELVFACIFCALFAFCYPLMEMFIWSQNRWQSKFGFLMLTTIGLFLQVGSISLIVFLAWKIRLDLLEARGAPENEDGRWGFGQVAAVLMWAPLAHDIIALVWEHFPRLRRARIHNAKRPGDDVEAGTSSESVPLFSTAASDSVIVDGACPVSKVFGPGRQQHPVLKRAATS